MASHSSTGFLKAKIQIGNTKGPLDYQLKQTVFHHDDVPQQRRVRVEEVKEYARRKILDETPTWSKSSKPEKLVCERRTMENYAKDRSHQFTYNYRAESLDPMRNIEPLDKSTKFHVSVQLETTAKEIMQMRKDNPVHRGQFHRTQEVPNHPDLVDATPWNNTAVLTVKELNQGLDEKTKHAQQWTGKVNATLKLKRSYVSPMQQTILMQEKIRQQKHEGTFSASELINPPRKMPELTYTRTNREQNDKMRKVKLTEHSGVWGPNSVDGRYVQERIHCAIHFLMINETILSCCIDLCGQIQARISSTLEAM